MINPSIQVTQVENISFVEERESLNFIEIIHFMLFFGFIIAALLMGFYKIFSWIFSVLS